MQIMQYATMSFVGKAVSPSIANFVFPHPHSSNASTISTRKFRRRAPPLRCSDWSAAASTSLSPPPISTANTGTAPPVVRRRMRYRKQYPGESKGITEEMRFVAMKLRNINGKKLNTNSNNSSSDDDDGDGENDDNAPVEDNTSESDADGDGVETETWRPSLEGFIKYLVDSKLVFDTVERVVDESNDVAYAYFRKTGLERSESLSEDLEWLKQQGNVIPEPSNPGVSYAKYLEGLAEDSAPLFLCHFYNIYFSHIAGGQVIARQVSEKLLEGRELAFCTWEEDVQELLKGVREKLNKLGEKLDEVQDFLRLPHGELKSRQVKMHTTPVSKQVEDWEDAERTLRGTSCESFMHANYQLHSPVSPTNLGSSDSHQIEIL